MNSNHEGGGDFRLFEIRTSQISTPPSGVRKLWETLNLVIPEGAGDSIKIEYLVIDHIPSQAIISIQSAEKIAEGMDFPIA